MRQKVIGYLVAICMLVLFSGTAHALSVSYSNSYGYDQTNWSHNLGFQQFDPSLGTLKSVTFTLTVNMHGYVSYFNTGGAATLYGSVAALTSLSRPAGGALLVSASPFVTIAPQSSPLAIGAGSSGSTPVQFSTATSTDTLLFSNMSLLDQQLFIGNGSFNLFASSNSGSDLFTSGSGLFKSEFVDSMVDITVRYNYDPEVPVPEPGTFMLIGSGLLAGSGFVRRRFKRAERN